MTPRLRWGLIGGGEGSQIGPAHRIAARLDGCFELCAGALDHRPEAGKAFAISLGIDAERAYGDWREMLSAEAARASERLDLITVATPNNTHFEIARACLEAGFDVMVEKPMTITVEEGETLVQLARKQQRVCAVNYGYTGYPLVRQMREMVQANDLGKIRLVVAEFAHGHHADAADADNPRVRWRYDPTQAGVSAQFADCGIHALHMASFVTEQNVTEVSADCVSLVPGRELEDDAMVNFRMDGGAVGRLWTSSVAIGRQHGLAIQIFGERGGLRWAQEQPNQLWYQPLGQRLQVIERGESGLYPAAASASRVTVGHAEGMPLAFANLYRDIAAQLTLRKQARVPDPGASLVPDAEAGVRSVAAVYAVAASAAERGVWKEARPQLFRD